MQPCCRELEFSPYIVDKQSKVIQISIKKMKE